MQHTPEEIARAIAQGHGYEKHVVNQHEFDGSKKRCGADTGVRTREEYESHILKTITKPDVHAFIGEDKAAHFYDRETNTHVIYDPSRDDLGTCMRPTSGDRLIQREWDQDCKARGWQLSRFQDLERDPSAEPDRKNDEIVSVKNVSDTLEQEQENRAKHEQDQALSIEPDRFQPVERAAPDLAAERERQQEAERVQTVQQLQTREVEQIQLQQEQERDRQQVADRQSQPDRDSVNARDAEQTRQAQQQNMSVEEKLAATRAERQAEAEAKAREAEERERAQKNQGRGR